MPEHVLPRIRVRLFQEKDGSWAAACSSLGVYSVGRTRAQAVRRFRDALDLHLDVIREKAMAALSV